MWASKPTIYIKKLGDKRFTWILCLSNNKKKPSCVSPTEYSDAFKCRDMAKTFAMKFRGPLRLVSASEGVDEIIDVTLVDETRKGYVNGDELDKAEAQA
jgi:hypothetical protein